MVKNTVKCVALLLFCLLTAPLFAQVPSNTPKIVFEGREYYRYTVEKGIGLYRIAKNFGVSQDDILRVNPSAGQGLVEGQELLVPVVSESQNVDGLKGQRSHLVEKGQTLYSIASKYGVSVEEVMKLNPEVREGLKEGMSLRIPGTVKALHPTVRDEMAGFVAHTVQPKETVFGIARKYNISVDDLLAQNPGLKEQGLQAGSMLRIKQGTEVTAKVTPEAITGDDVFEMVHFHKLAAGENLHSLARNYNIPYSTLVDANVGVDAEKVGVGTIVAVPQNPLLFPQLLSSPWYTTHKVGKKETLYGISKTCGVPSGLIAQFNPKTKLDELEKGQVLNLPTADWIAASREVTQRKNVTQPDEELTLPLNNCNGYDYAASRPTLRVALILPFNLSASASEALVDTTANGNDESVDANLERKAIGGRTKLVVEFYEGFLLGLDKWKQKGVNIQLQTYDTGNGASEIMRVLNKPELATVDLIVGPAYAEHVRAVSDFSASHKIKMVSPFNVGSVEMRTNPNLFMASAIDTLEYDAMAKHLIEKARNGRLVIVKSSGGSSSERRMIKALRNCQVAGKARLSWREVVFSKSESGVFTSHLLRDSNNVIVVPSENEVFVSQVVITLDAITDRNQYPMEVYGLPEWLKFQTVDPEALHKMNGRIFANFGMDYSNAETQRFITEFRSLYQSEPVAFMPFFQRVGITSAYNRYGAWGYDLAHYFIGAMVAYGKSFEGCLSKLQDPYLVQSNFKFRRISNWGGFYNSGLFVHEFNKDFSIRRITVE